MPKGVTPRHCRLVPRGPCNKLSRVPSDDPSIFFPLPSCSSRHHLFPLPQVPTPCPVSITSQVNETTRRNSSSSLIVSSSSHERFADQAKKIRPQSNTVNKVYNNTKRSSLCFAVPWLVTQHQRRRSGGEKNISRAPNFDAAAAAAVLAA